MSRIIRQALAERLLKSPRVASFLRDFSVSTGLRIRFATPLGVELRIEGAAPEPAVCSWMRQDAARGRICARTVQAGATETGAGLCGAACSAGLREAAVPLRLRGELYGYLLAGQVATHPLDIAAINRWRHALEREGIAADAEELSGLAESVPVVSEASFEAALRLLEWSTSQLAEQMEDHIRQPVESMPAAARKATALIQARFDQDLSLGEVAAAVGLSREHFCSVFHKGTGLRFVDYLTRVRVDRAGELLRGTDKSIAEVALECGFQSISHFNRRFRALTGKTPTAWRSESGQGK